MSAPIAKDPRVKSVEWRDLLPLSSVEIINELFIGTPWLLGSWYCYLQGGAWWITGGCVCAFFFFLCGLRVVHGCYHYAMGIGRWGCEFTMFVLSVLMMSAMHAIQATHLHHHRHCMDDEDIEAWSAKLPGWQALLFGPIFTWNLHTWGWKLCKNKKRKRWLVAEFIAVPLFTLFVFFGLEHISPAAATVMKIHVIVMAIGQCGTGFFAVWTVHHDCDRDGVYARTQKGWVKNFISYNMFHHVEHHLYPAVPTCHLPRLAQRLEAAMPEARSKGVY